MVESFRELIWCIHSSSRRQEHQVCGVPKDWAKMRHSQVHSYRSHSERKILTRLEGFAR